MTHQDIVLVGVIGCFWSWSVWWKPVPFAYLMSNSIVDPAALVCMGVAILTAISVHDSSFLWYVTFSKISYICKINICFAQHPTAQ